MPGHDHGPSIKKPDTYEALKRRGMSKTKAAKISNAQAAGTINRPKKKKKKKGTK
jgi:hypothetical protein